MNMVIYDKLMQNIDFDACTPKGYADLNKTRVKITSKHSNHKSTKLHTIRAGTQSTSSPNS